jgi:hypothetical protein
MPLRHFASPLYANHRRADMPWHSADDLRAVLRLPDEVREVFQRKMKSDWEEVRTVATPDGITTIAPHFMAEGMIEFVLDNPGIMPEDVAKRVRGAYRRATTASMRLMVAHLPPMERMFFALAAME